MNLIITYFGGISIENPRIKKTFSENGLVNDQEGQRTACRRRKQQLAGGDPPASLRAQKGGLDRVQPRRADVFEKVLRLVFKRFFGGIGAVILEVKHSAFKVRILCVVDFNNSFIRSSYHDGALSV